MCENPHLRLMPAYVCFELAVNDNLRRSDVLLRHPDATQQPKVILMPYLPRLPV
jgi:hypothetical protein